MDRGEGCLFWKNAWNTYNMGRVCIGENLVQKVDVQYVMYAFILIYSYVFFTYFHKRKYSALLHQLAGGIVYSSVCLCWDYRGTVKKLSQFCLWLKYGWEFHLLFYFIPPHPHPTSSTPFLVCKLWNLKKFLGVNHYRKPYLPMTSEYTCDFPM